MKFKPVMFCSYCTLLSLLFEKPVKVSNPSQSQSKCTIYRHSTGTKAADYRFIISIVSYKYVNK